MKLFIKIIAAAVFTVLFLSGRTVTVLAENDSESSIVLSDEGTAYAVLTDAGELIFFRSRQTYDNGKTGTFRDTNETQYSGTLYTGIEERSEQPPWRNDVRKIKKVYTAAGQTVRPVSTASWFYYGENLKSADFSGFDTGRLTDASGMFGQCSSLTDLNLSGFDTSNVENMELMFYLCKSLTDLDLSGFDTRKVTSMHSMFSACSGLKEIDVSHFETSNVTQMGGMFSGCAGLSKLDLSSFDTRNVTNMSFMFADCTSLSDLDISTLNTANVTDMSSMFRSCRKLTELDLSHFETGNVTDMLGMFSDCDKLRNLDLSSFDTCNVEWMADMFKNCSGLTALDLSSFSTGHLVYTANMFRGCYSLTALDIGHFKTGRIWNMADMFSGCSSLKELDLSGFDTAGVDYMGDLFSGCSSLESIDLSSFDTGSVTSMAGMFSGCMSLKTLDLSSFNTSAVTDMCMMFNRCSSLETLGLSNFDTSNVTNMRNMFDECTRLKTLDLSSFKTAGVTDMSNMFSDCRELKQLDLKSFDTGSVQYMSQMFSGCVTLSALNVSSFDTARVVGMDRMFFDCSSLKNLDLSSFATRSVSRMDSMFDGSGISSVVLGSGFSVWQDRAYLPAGTWTHSKSGKSLSEKELYSQYPSNTSSLAGTWSGKLQTVRVNELWMKVLGSSSIRTGMKTFVYALVYPDNATNKKVRWSSSSPSVASVDRYGIVTARKAGRTIITAVTEDGSYTGTFEIRVLFNDVPESGAYYSNPVYWAVDRGITNGYTDDDGLVRTFRPQNNCTREAVVTFLWRLAGKPMPKSTDSPFSDVQDKTKYYYNAVLWAAEKGITGGYSDGTFRPSATCLREHVVTFLWRYAGRPEVSMANSFTDISPSDYYYKAVLWAAKNNITKGYADDNYKTFRPKLDCLREHVVTFLYRYANLK